MNKAAQLEITIPKQAGSAFYILGGDNRPDDLPYATVSITSNPVNMMDMMFTNDDFADLIQRAIDDALRLLVQSMIELFGSGTFLIADQTGKNRKAKNAFASISTNGCHIQLHRTIDKMGFEAKVVTQVYAPMRQEGIVEIIVSPDGAISTRYDE